MIFIDDYNQKYLLYLYEICHDVKKPILARESKLTMIDGCCKTE